MQSVSADNLLITAAASSAREGYAAFLSGLRGVVAEGLSGISNGTKSLMGIERDVKRLADHHEERVLEQLKRELLGASLSALSASERAGGGYTSERSLAVSESLVAGFYNSLSETVGKQMKRDAAKADTFMRRQLIQGRSFATTEELIHDLTFKFVDKSGREIDSDEYAFREANWALRQHFNSVLLYSASELGVEMFVVDGGSKSGTKLTLDDYDKHSGAIFHHNSKALLQPLTNYSVS